MHLHNPDNLINSHGKKLKNICNLYNCDIINICNLYNYDIINICNLYNYDIINICNLYNHDIINGLNEKYDSKFTCFRGKMRSNDICITNDTSLIKHFEIMDRILISDHSPCIIMLNMIPSTPLYFLETCSKSFLNDDQYDISNRLKSTVKFTNIDCIKVVQQFYAIASEIDTL